MLDLFESLHTDHISIAAFADHRTLVTASLDCTVSVWSITSSSSGRYDVQLKAGLFGHRQPVHILVVSRTLSIVLSGSIDGRVLLWDLNRSELVRELPKWNKIDFAQIDHKTGHIILCSGQTAKLYTINGELILEQRLCSDLQDRINCCAFYTSSGNEWIEGEYILTGHTQGIAKVSDVHLVFL